MKRVLIIAILGLAGAPHAYAQPNTQVLFDSYLAWPNAALAWTISPGLAPAGRAGQQLGAESQYFTANLWFGIGQTPTTWYQAPDAATGAPASSPVVDLTTFGYGGGYITTFDTPQSWIMVDLTGAGLPVYSTGPYSFRFVVTGHGPYEGAYGMFQFTEPAIDASEYPNYFTQLPAGPSYTYGGALPGLMPVITMPVPEHSTMTLASLTALTIAFNRPRFPENDKS